MNIGNFRHMKICCPECNGLPAGCESCGETGLCCPTCNGAGKVAKLRPTRVSEIVLCPTCQLEMSTGAEYNDIAVDIAIDRYIDDWFEGRIADPVLTHRKLAEAGREEREREGPQRGRLWKHG